MLSTGRLAMVQSRTWIVNKGLGRQPDRPRLRAPVSPWFAPSRWGRSCVTFTPASGRSVVEVVVVVVVVGVAVMVGQSLNPNPLVNHLSH